MGSAQAERLLSDGHDRVHGRCFLFRRCSGQHIPQPVAVLRLRHIGAELRALSVLHSAGESEILRVGIRGFPAAANGSGTPCGQGGDVGFAGELSDLFPAGLRHGLAHTTA